MPKNSLSAAVIVILACAMPGTAVAAATSQPASAAAQGGMKVRIGSISVPADCALARKEHPRMLFTKADLPGIKERIKKPTLKPIYDRMKKTVDDQMAQGVEAMANRDPAQVLVPLGLLYHITGEEKYGQACRAVTLKAPFGVYSTMGAYGYDLAYDLLSPEERQACEKKMLDYARRGSATTTDLVPLINAVGIWGDGQNDDEMADIISKVYQATLARKKFLDEWAADRGGDSNSHDYLGQHEYVGTMGALQAWRAATGEDLFEGFNWARTVGPYYIYNILPDRKGTAHIGVDSGGQIFFPWETGAEAFVSIAQAKWQDGVTGWWVRNMVCNSTMSYDILFRNWGAVLWYDPDVPDIAQTELPEDVLFKIRGYVYARSNWANDATFINFSSGRFELDSRNNCDANSFMIWRKAYLACDSGTKASMNPSDAVTDGYNYWPQTIAHNSITIGTANSTDYGTRSVAGGQFSRVPVEWLKMYGMPATADNMYTRQAGQIKAYETSPEFVYTVGDARCAYDPHKVSGFTRQFLYVRPGAVVIFDRVNAVNANDPKRWYLHTMEQPQCIDGQLAADTTVHPDGHFLAGGKTLRAPHAGSVLFSKTLLPENAIIRVLGGKGHQFEVDGVNHDMTEAWWKKMETPDYQGYLERIGIGYWRVEVEPQEKKNEDIFLHVLWATVDTAKEMFPVEKIEKDGQVGAKFTADGSEVEVTFAQAGAVAGHIKITKDGKVICDRPLASKIEDNYQKWNSDKRFNEWMTNPYMRSVIGEKDQDLFKAGKVEDKPTGAAKPG